MSDNISPLPKQPTCPESEPVKVVVARREEAPEEPKPVKVVARYAPLDNAAGGRTALSAEEMSEIARRNFRR